MSNWDFSLNKAANAVWTEGLREIFEYRDLGIKEATKGDYIAHIVKANGKEYLRTWIGSKQRMRAMTLLTLGV